jgi:hypothetical protein
MRFVRQPTEYSCGPIAIINALKWAGEHCTLRQHHALITLLCKATYSLGTDEFRFESGLRSAAKGLLRIRKRKQPTFASILGHIRQPDRAVILLYWYPEAGYDKRTHEPVTGHYTLVFSNHEDSSMVCINDSEYETITKISVDELKKRIRFLKGREPDGPRAWYIQRA